MDFDVNTFGNAFLGGGAGALFAGLALVVFLIAIAFYIYFALAWTKIAKKMKYPRPWLAWIPFANIAMWLQLGGFHWAWVFLILVPYVGTIAILVMVVVAHWRVFEKLKYPPWLSLSLALGVIPLIGLLGVIAYAIVIGIVAWKK